MLNQFLNRSPVYNRSQRLAGEINIFVEEMNLQDHWLAVPTSERAKSISATLICIEPINQYTHCDMFIVKTLKEAQDIVMNNGLRSESWFRCEIM